MNDVERLINIVGSTKRAAWVLGVSPDHVRRMATGAKETPHYVRVITDFLEQTAPVEWPKSVRDVLGVV